MLSNFLTKFAQVKTRPLKEELNRHGLNWCTHEKPWVLIYFSTSWCAPCRNMAPIIDELSALYAVHLKVIKIDVDEQTQLAKQLGVTGVPTLVLLEKSGIKSRLIGGVNSDDINNWLSKSLD